MNKKIGYPILVILLFACVLLAFWYPYWMLSPGELISGHQKLKTDCLSCHALLRGIPAENCIVCHTIDEIGLLTSTGALIQQDKKGNVSFHQNLIEEDCTACHTDHQGIDAAQHIQTFSHELIQTSVRNQCTSCHQSPQDSFHQNIAGNCSQCHSQTKWIPATFDHRQYFRFDSDHKDDCVTCHLDNNYRQYTCYECHEHSPSKIRKEHLEEGINDYENCAECHRSGDEHEAKRLWRSKSSKDNRSSDREHSSRRKNKRHDDEDDDD